MITSTEPSPRLIVIGESSSARLGADEVGSKALNLVRMTEAGLPVPPAFVLSTEVCRDYYTRHEVPDDVDALLATGITALERSTGLEFGGRRRPLLVAARSGAAVSMPGMLETVLNIGLCDSTISGLIRASGDPRFVWDSYRRLVRQYGEVVRGLDSSRFDDFISTLMRRESVVEVDELDVAALRELTARSLALFVDEPFPQSPTAQLRGATLAVLRSWSSPRAAAYRRLEQLSDEGGTAVTVQAMVFGNMGATSGAGVGFTRDPATGEDHFYVDFLVDAQGEDLVSGRRGTPESAAAIAVVPGLAQELGRVRRRLEALFGDVQDFEFTVQEGRLHILQSRAARRTPWAALQIACDLVDEGLIDAQAGLGLLAGIDLDAVSRTRLAEGVSGSLLAVGIPASPGVACGPMTLSIDTAQQCAEAGRPAILIRAEPTTSDVAGLGVCAALVTSRGARTSHAAVVARQLDLVCVVGCDDLLIPADEGICRFGNRIIAEGELLSIDGTTGQVYAGELATVVERPEALIERIKRWGKSP